MKFKLINNWRDKVSPMQSIKLENLTPDEPYTLSEIKQITQTSLPDDKLKVVIQKMLSNVFIELKIMDKKEEVSEEKQEQTAFMEKQEKVTENQIEEEKISIKNKRKNK